MEIYTMSENQNPGEEQKPAENEIADYYDGVKKLEMEGHETGIKKARNALFITAALLLVGEIISMSQSGLEWTPLAIAIVAIEVGIFIALGLWTKTKPYTAIIVGLIVFIGLWIWALSIIGFDQIARGILMRIIIISVLISALKPAKAWEDLKKNS
jgi:Flp pilus assembly protein TadB